MKTFLITFRGPAMEYRDVSAGEKPYDEYTKEVEANNEDEAMKIGKKMADAAGEGAEVFYVEPLL